MRHLALIMIFATSMLQARAVRPDDIQSGEDSVRWKHQALAIIEQIIDGTYKSEIPVADEGELDFFDDEFGEEDDLFFEPVASPKSAPVEQDDQVTLRIECTQQTRTAQRAATLLGLCYERAYSTAKPGSLIEFDPLDPYTIIVGPLNAQGLVKLLNAECGRHLLVFTYKKDDWASVDVSIAEAKPAIARRQIGQQVIRTYDLPHGRLYDSRLGAACSWSAGAYLFDPTVTQNLHLFVTKQWHVYNSRLKSKK